MVVCGNCAGAFILYINNQSAAVRMCRLQFKAVTINPISPIMIHLKGKKPCIPTHNFSSSSNFLPPYSSSNPTIPKLSFHNLSSPPHHTSPSYIPHSCFSLRIRSTISGLWACCARCRICGRPLRVALSVFQYRCQKTRL
jgi:hypothetical protein